MKVRMHLAGLATAAIMTLGASGLELGDKAPPLDGIKTWLNGAAANPATSDGKTVYVVEFWATWCPPCKQSIPHLSALQEKYKDGQVVLIGVTDEDEATVQAYSSSVKIGYRVALDTAKTTEKTWRAGIEGIPHAFIVDAKGLVVWQGHPMDGLDRALAAVLNGTYDPAKTKARESALNKLMQMLNDGNVDQAMKALNEMLAAEPGDRELHEIKIGLMVQGDDAAGFLDEVKTLHELSRSSSEALNQLAWMLVQPSPLPLKFGDPERAIAAAREAVELTHGRDADVLDTLATAYYRAGLLDEAMETAAKALALNTDDEARKQVLDTMGFFKRAQAARSKYGKPEPPPTPAAPEAPVPSGK